jgi:hypothetical protein
MKLARLTLLCVLGWQSASLAQVHLVIPRAHHTPVPGVYKSPDGSCSATVSVNLMGGQSELKVADHIVSDVTGAIWIPPRDLVYSVSPVYGNPGIYLYSCRSAKTHVLVGPTHRTEAYPDGTDYFELSGNQKRGPKLFYYYVSDVQRLNLKELGEKIHLTVLDLSSLKHEEADK